ncbi:MAG: hypothetical protein H6748_10715 [Spirochaetaceae bacterium]|nr:hypothetical protein [Spirochaetaceae bacterium]
MKRPPRTLRPTLAVALWLGLALVLGCRGADRSSGAAARRESERAARRAALESSIAEDHATLEALVARPRDEGDPPLYDDPTLRAIAARLSENERALAALRASDAAPATDR